MTTAETLKKLLRLWAILWDVDVQTAMKRVLGVFHVKTFRDNEAAQILAIAYLKYKLQKGDDDDDDM